MDFSVGDHEPQSGTTVMGGRDQRCR